MKFHNIDHKGDHVAVPSPTDVEIVAQVRRFSTEAGFAGLAAEWPTSHLVRIWNALPSVGPVKRFNSRRLAVARIWNYVQTLDDFTRKQRSAATSPPLSPHMSESISAPSADPGSHSHGRLRHSGGSRTEAIVALLRQPGGATLDSIKGATGWQSHSVRGFISGTVRGKLKLNVVSGHDGNGARIYRVEI